MMTANGLTDGARERVALDGDPIAFTGDKGYRADWIDEYLLDRGITPVIPSKENDIRSARLVDFDRELDHRRNIVEWLIGCLKEYRRVFSRFEKTAENLGGMLRIAFIQRDMKVLFGNQ